VNYGLLITFIGLVLAVPIYWYNLSKELYILAFGLLVYGVIQIVAGAMQKQGKTDNGLVVIINDLSLMPKTMMQLAFVQFFSWFALFALWIYTTAGVTSHIYDMKMNEQVVDQLQKSVSGIEVTQHPNLYENLPTVKKDLQKYQQKLAGGQQEVVASMQVVKFFLDEKKDLDVPEQARNRLKYIQQQYNTGADWVGVAFAVYNGFAAIVAFLLPVIAKYTNRRVTHALSLIIGGISLISMYFIGDPMLILVAMIGVGLAWASILAMPYAILAGALPPDKMGIYMGIFNFFIVLPQILAATILGFITETLFNGHAILALVLGGFTWFVAAIFTMFVDDVDEVSDRSEIMAPEVTD